MRKNSVIFLFALIMYIQIQHDLNIFAYKKYHGSVSFEFENGKSKGKIVIRNYNQCCSSYYQFISKKNVWFEVHSSHQHWVIKNSNRALTPYYHYYHGDVCIFLFLSFKRENLICSLKILIKIRVYRRIITSWIF